MKKEGCVYVALLRGINVGGKNKVDMKKLKSSFEKRGMSSVVTYINSGNIVFVDTKRSKKEIVEILEKAIVEDFKLQIKVVIRNLEEFNKVLKAVPKSWSNDDSMKSDVLFLWEEVDNRSVIKEVNTKQGIDTVKYVSGALLWSIDRKDVTKSGMIKLVGTALYKQMTIRNVNTVRKIHEIMKKVYGEL